MTNRERAGYRDLYMSRFHHAKFDDEASALDLDLVGVCKSCNDPLYVWETTRASSKGITWTQRTAMRLNVPGYLITYEVHGETKCGECHRPNEDGTLVIYAVCQVYPGPKRSIGHEAELVAHIRKIRADHAATWHGIAS